MGPTLSIGAVIRYSILSIAIFLIVFGACELYRIATNWEPLEVTIQEYEKSPKNKKWMRIKGGFIDLSEAASAETSADDPVQEMYLPLRDKEAVKGDPVSVLLVTKDARIIEVAQGLARIGNEEEHMRFAIRHFGSLHQRRDIQGMVHLGSDMDEEEVAQLRKRIPGLKESFAIIDGTIEPVPLKAMMLLVGSVLVALFIRMSRKPPPPPPMPPGPRLRPIPPRPPIPTASSKTEKQSSRERKP